MSNNKFHLTTFDKDVVVELVNVTGAKHIDAADTGSHEGRKAVLKHLGVDAQTPDNYRFVMLENSAGQIMAFKGPVDGAKKLVLTDSMVLPEPDKMDMEKAWKTIFNAPFHHLAKPIEVEVAKSTFDKEQRANLLSISPAEEKKLETTTTLVALVQKSEGVRLASNASLPNKPGIRDTSYSV